MLAGKYMLLCLFRRLFQNPPGERKMRTSQGLVSPSCLLSCSVLFTFLLKLPSSTGGVSCPTLSLSTSLTCHGSDTPRFPSSAGRFSLSDHQYFIPRRKIMLGTDSNQVYKPWPASYSWGAGGRNEESTGSPLITTSFRSASSSTD